jgi:hypothetical protein
MLPRRYALLAMLAAVGCRDTTAPGPLLPAIKIQSPVSGAVIGDTIVQLRGTAEAPGAVDWVEITYNYANQPSTSTILYRYDEHYRSDGTIDSQSRVPFEAQLRMYAGARQVTVRMEYRIRRDEPIGNPERSTSVTVPFRIWKRPVLRLDTELPDTLYARAFTLIAGSVGLDTSPKVDLVIDPGTTNELHVDAKYPGPYPTTGAVDGPYPRLFDLADALSNGPHRLVLRLSDEMGAADSIVRNFVTYVAPVTYTVAPLPGLGGNDSDARDVNTTGDAAGWALDAGGVSRPVLWKGGAVTALATSSTALSGQAYSLNDVGDIVGAVDDTVDTGHCKRAIRWTTSTWRYVDVGRSLCDKAAMRVNASGATLVVLPYSWYGDTTAWVVRDSAVAYFQNFDPSQWLNDRGLLSLNDRGEVAGAQRNDYGTPTPFSSGPAIARPTFRALDNVGHPAGALAGLNNASQAVGAYAGTLFFSPQPGSALVDLNPYLLARSTPVALTENGSVLAFDPTDHAAYIWRAGRTYRVAIDADWSLDSVSAMNDAGVIVGHATQLSTGRTGAVIMRP